MRELSPQVPPHYRRQYPLRLRARKAVAAFLVGGCLLAGCGTVTTNKTTSAPPTPAPPSTLPWYDGLQPTIPNTSPPSTPPTTASSPDRSAVAVVCAEVGQLNGDASHDYDVYAAMIHTAEGLPSRTLGDMIWFATQGQRATASADSYSFTVYRSEIEQFC